MGNRYVATLRAVFDAEDEVEAIFIADQIRLNGFQDLDEDDGDILDVTQVTSNSLELSPEETLTQLKRARNLLIKTRIRQCYELAKELDQQLYALEHRADSDFSMAGYDYGKFMEIAEAILQRGEVPND